jgi:hypothetical protein
MGFADTIQIGSLTWATSLALITAKLYPNEPEEYIPVLVELICWSLVLAFFKSLPRHRLGTSKDVDVTSAEPPFAQYWHFGIGIAGATIFCSIRKSESIVVSYPSFRVCNMLIRASSLPLPKCSSLSVTFRHALGSRNHVLCTLEHGRYILGSQYYLAFRFFGMQESVSESANGWHLETSSHYTAHLLGFSAQNKIVSTN